MAASSGTRSARSALTATILVSFGLLLFQGCGSGRPRPPDGPAKRVILITCDTLRADHLGCYGYARPTTPRLDALAGESVLFENAWSAAPLTGPSISSLLTGRVPDEVGATRTNRELMPGSVTTLAEVLRDAGYATAAVVSNGVLRRPPAEQGQNRLFDLETDPSEVHDVAEQHPDVVRSLAQRYVEFMSRERGPDVQGTLRKMDLESLRGLPGLGYTDGDEGRTTGER